METVVYVRGKPDREKARGEWGGKRFGDDLFEVIRTFFTGSKKTPAKMYWELFIPF